MVVSYNRILLSNKKEITIDTGKDIDKSQNDYVELKKPNKKKGGKYWMIPFVCNSRRCKIIFSDRKQPVAS